VLDLNTCWCSVLECVCVYLFLCVWEMCAYTHAFLCICAPISGCVGPCVHAHSYSCMCICIHTCISRFVGVLHTHTFLWGDMCTHTHIPMCVWVCMYIHTYFCMCRSLCACTYVVLWRKCMCTHTYSCVYIHTHTHTHTHTHVPQQFSLRAFAALSPQ
jgi:hypothetical protein